MVSSSNQMNLLYINKSFKIKNMHKSKGDLGDLGDLGDSTYYPL